MFSGTIIKITMNNFSGNNWNSYAQVYPANQYGDLYPNVPWMSNAPWVNNVSQSNSNFGSQDAFTQFLTLTLKSFWFCAETPLNLNCQTSGSQNYNSGDIFGKNLHDLTFGNQFGDKSTWCSEKHSRTNHFQKHPFDLKASQRCSTSFENGISACAQSNYNTSDDTKKDMINYDALKGHPYEITENLDKKTKKKGSKLYICRYYGWNKVFYKTWNLVYHFRVHTNEKPYSCKQWGKKFTQKANLRRHLPVHDTTPLHKRKVYDCPKCSRKYSNKYNLNVGELLRKALTFIYRHISRKITNLIPLHIFPILLEGGFQGTENLTMKREKPGDFIFNIPLRFYITF